mgnify:FL=1
MDLAQKLGMYIRQQRGGRSWTQDDLAFAASVSIDTVRKLEKGTGTPKISSLLSVLDVLGASEDLVESINPLNKQIPLNSLLELDRRRVRRRKGDL